MTGSPLLFQGVARHIEAKIAAGEYAPGARVPTERAFEAELGVSRATVRRALDELVSAGALETRGRSAYVPERAASQNTLLSLTEMARVRGLTPSARVLKQRVREATLDEADALGIAPGAALFELGRLRLLDGAANALDHDRLPLKLLPDAMSIDFTSASLYASLAAAGHAPVRSHLQIEARAATREEAALLDLQTGAPLLVAHERADGQDDRTVTLGCTIYRSDRHRFLATFHRRAPHSQPRRRT